MNQKQQADVSHVLPVIMAGGEGTRLRPITETVPKPLIPIDGVPVIVRALRLLYEAGFRRAVITVRYLGALIRKRLGTYAEGIALSYLEESADEPLGTAGSVCAAWRRFAAPTDTDVLTVSGDAVFSAELGAFLSFHRETGADVTVLTAKAADPGAFGVVLCEKDGRITGFSEKPSAMETVTDTVNTGIYLLTGAFAETLTPPGSTAACDFGKNSFPAALAGGQPLFAFPSDGYWCDIGTPETLLSCTLALADGSLARFSPLLRPGQRIFAPYVFHSSMGEGCFIPAGASVRDSALYDRVTLAPGASVSGSVLCSGVSVGRDAVLERGCVIGEGAVIGDGVHLAAGTHVSAGAVIRVPSSPARPGETDPAADPSAPAEPAGSGSDDAPAHPSRTDPAPFSRYLHDSGCYLAPRTDPFLPDIAFCLTLSRALLLYAEKKDCALFLARTQPEPALGSAAALLQEGLSLYAGEEGEERRNGTETRIYRTEGVVPFAAARAFSPDCRPLLSVLLTVTEGRLSAVFCMHGAEDCRGGGTAAGFYFSRDEERAFDACLAAASSAQTGIRRPSSVSVPRRPVPLVPIPKEQIVNAYLNAHGIPLRGLSVRGLPPAGAVSDRDRSRFLFRTGNTPEERLLAGLLCARGFTESQEAELFFHLFPASSADDGEGTLTAADMTLPSRTYSHWELFAMLMLGGENVPERMTLPFGVPDFLIRILAEHGVVLFYDTHCSSEPETVLSERRKHLPPAARDGVLLASGIAALLAERRITLTALYKAVFGDRPVSRIRISRRYPSSRTAEALRRLTEDGAGFSPQKEGVLLRTENAAEPVSGTAEGSGGIPSASQLPAGTVRVIGSRSSSLRIVADAYSAEAAEALCGFAEKRIAEQNVSPLSAAKR